MKNIFTRRVLDGLSQVFINLAADWFAVVLIAPGFTKLSLPNDFLWLIKNLTFAIISLIIGIKLSRKK